MKYAHPIRNCLVELTNNGETEELFFEVSGNPKKEIHSYLANHMDLSKGYTFSILESTIIRYSGVAQTYAYHFSNEVA